MRLFLTGASGFVGYHLAAAFRAARWDVTALVRARSNVSALQELGVDLALGELLDAGSFSDRVAGSDLVIHCAGLIRAVTVEEYTRVNAEGAGVVAATASRVGVPRFILISSIAARGPLGRGDSAPVSHYGTSKREGEKRVFERAGAMSVCVVRPPVIYGPRDNGMLAVFKAARRGLFPLYGRGGHRVAIVHVDDLVRAIQLLATCPGDLPAGPFYPEDGTNPSWAELASAFGSALGRKIWRIPLPPFLFQGIAALATGWSLLVRRPVLFSVDKVREMACPDWTASHKELTRAVGFKPQIPLVRGLGETARWYRRQGWI